MAWTPSSLAQQTGRTVVVTGGNSGIGLEAARVLVARGAHVVLAVRDLARGEAAAASLSGPGPVDVVRLDLADLDQVGECAKALSGRLDSLGALVCNAGIMSGPAQLTAQGFERQMGTNHLGHAALVTGLWPLLHTSAARVVLVTSLAARAGRLSPHTTREQLVAPVPYDGGRVYANTKQANLLFALELHRRASRAGSAVSAVAAHPGVSATNLLTRTVGESSVPALVPVARAVQSVVFQTAAAGALPTLRALDHSTPSGSFVGPGGPGQLRGRPVLVDVPSTGQDPSTAAHLWQLTEQVLGTPLPV